MPKSFGKLIFTSLIIILGLFIVSPHTVSADANGMLWDGGAGAFQLTSGLGSGDPRIIAAAIIRILLGFMGLIALGLVLYGGWLWMTSAGESDKIDKAKKVLISAAIGLVIILMSFAIASYVINALYNATTGTSSPTCSAATVGTCNGCQMCTFTGSYVWQFNPSCGATCTLVPPSTISCDSNTMTAACDASNAICDASYAPGTYFCDSGSCTCKPLGNIGDPCTASTTACVADDLLCMADLKCNTGTCICEGAPVVDWISPVDMSNIPFGAPGNIVTIGGRFFGTTTGSVWFWDGSDFTVKADFPNTINPNCTDFWSDNQVIVIVPGGAAVDGPVRIKRADGEKDETNNTRGPSIPDFDINATVLPGVCQLNPAIGPYGTAVTYHGINFLPGATQANFGKPSGFVPAISSNFTTALLGQAAVPNIDLGRTTTYASTTTGVSNALYFQVIAASSTGPYITSFDPASGPPKQYVTIYGSGFGSSKGTSQVFFGPSSSGIEANYDFPAVCTDTFWSDNQVIVKVPNTIPDNNYVITMVIGGVDIDTSSLSPDTFTVSNSSPLTPGLCKIFPKMAPNNSEIKLWGEYFNAFSAADSKVRFHLNQDQSGPLSTLGPIMSWGPVDDTDVVEVLVHNSAATGPVRIVKNGPLVSNGLNLTVGKCSKDIDCGTGNTCCPAGSFAAGRCVASVNDCYSSIINSVFEWDFDTALASNTFGVDCNDSPNPSMCIPNNLKCPPSQTCNTSTCKCEISGLNSCLGYSLSQCLPSTYCPNSPGECSAYAGGTSKTVGTCQNNCNGIGGCGTSKTCNYNASLDKCVITGSICDGTKTVKDIKNNDVTAYCADYSGTGRWHIQTAMSCPSGWQRIPGNICVDLGSTCSFCLSDEKCLGGLCAIDKDICPGTATCNVSNQCIQIDSAKCECCCDVGSTGECCYPLECKGTCGADTIDDGAGYGMCTGCAKAGTTQADHDAACNCTGTTGKYCDDTTNPDGVCRDCAELSTAALCGAHAGATTCCIDAKAGNACRGNKNGDMPLLGYCTYYNCEIATPDICASTTPVTTGLYADKPSCVSGCAANSLGSGLGLSCASLDDVVCNTPICGSPFSCIPYLGGAPNIATDCGVCCCDPLAPIDACAIISSTTPGVNLKCKADQSPCSGASRGLCCGCYNNNDCGSPMISGCGTDTCCRARPSVISTMPADGQTEVCRNTLITATFDQKMDVASFSGNVIVAGDYGLSTCPPGTEYVALGGRMPHAGSLFSRIYHWLVDTIKVAVRKIVPSDTAVAYVTPSATSNYCAVKGTITGYNNPLNQTVMQFAPSTVLDPDRLYYAIIKGDADFATTTGVANLWGIGMIGPDNTNNTFNGITYPNAKIISFTTMKEQTKNSGVCKLDHVTIDPASYLFQTNKNDANENDTNPLDGTFDTITDSDKVFVAWPRAANNQILNPLPGIYAWSWSWSSDNASVAGEIPVVAFTENKRLIRASDSVTDGRTVIRGKATITDDVIFSSTGSIIAGAANVYVFVCANPWPPVDSFGLWAPWIDKNNNCTVNLPACVNTNYEMYYCRDNGSYGSFDDLPGIKSNNAVIMGNSATTSLLKEAYYFREAVPDKTSLLAVVNNGIGGTVDVNWSAVAGVAGYKLYWGKNSGDYTDFLDVGNVTSKQISGLADGQKYYFNITSYSAQMQESELYGEVEVTPNDTTPPGTPIGVSAASTATGTAEISWSVVADADSYAIAYGNIIGVYGFVQEIGNDTSVKLTDLISGKTYYFAAIAIDAAGNRATSSASSAVIK